MPSQSANSYHHGNLRADLIDTGLVMLKEKGPDSFSLRQLSEEVGVTRTAPAHHFGSKNGLLAAIAAKGYQMLLELRQKRIEGLQGYPRARLVVAAASYVEFALDEPELFTLMFSTMIKDRDDYPELVDAQRRAFYGLAEFLKEYATETRQDISIDGVAYGLWSLAHGIATLKINQPGAPSTIQDIPTNDLSRHLVEGYLDGTLRSSG